MSTEIKRSWKDRILGELRTLSLTVLYLWILLSVFALHREIILPHFEISYSQKFGFALLNAVILAKFMWLADLLHAGKQWNPRPNQGVPMPEPEKTEYLTRLRAWGEADDGEQFYMVNLLSFKNPIEPWPGTNIPLASAEATNQVYVKGITPLILGSGRACVSTGSSGKSNLEGYDPTTDGWTQVNVNRYPNAVLCSCGRA